MADKKWSYDVQGGLPQVRCMHLDEGQCPACLTKQEQQFRDASEFTEGVNAAIYAIRLKAGELFAEGGHDEEAHAFRAAADLVLAEARDWRQL